MAAPWPGPGRASCAPGYPERWAGAVREPTAGADHLSLTEQWRSSPEILDDAFSKKNLDPGDRPGAARPGRQPPGGEPAEAGLAVLAAGEPWLPPAAPVEGLGQHLGQECSDHCGSQFQLELVHCESLPPLLRNLCLTQILAEVEACMAKCLGEAGAEPLEPMP